MSLKKHTCRYKIFWAKLHPQQVLKIVNGCFFYTRFKIVFLVKLLTDLSWFQIYSKLQNILNFITLRTESSSIFLDKSGRGRNLCHSQHPRQFILNMLQIQIFASEWERTSSFSPFCICISSGFGSSIGTISPWESKLAMFQCKEDKKTES